MISKSFSRLRPYLKRVNKIYRPQIYPASQLQYPKHTINMIFKQTYEVSNNFQKLKKHFEDQFATQDDHTDRKSVSPNSQTSTKKPEIPKLSEQLIKLAKQLQQEQSYFIAPLYHTQTFHYASFLLTAVHLLTIRKAFSDQKVLKTYFRQVKNSIKSSQTKIFTPKSALRLLEQFAIIDFDGDESLSLNKIVDYIEQNINEFSQIQLENLKVAYKDIMVNKAFGPVKFRPLNLEKKYKTQTERKAMVVKEKLIKMLKTQNAQKELSVDFSHTKKWFSVKLPSKNLYMLTYPSIFNLMSDDQIYHYIYDMKQLVSVSRLKKQLVKSPPILQIQIRQFSSCESLSDYQTFVDQGIVYRKKNKVADETQKINQMRKLSLKEQIERINEKKKALKQKQKNKGKQTVILPEQKQLLGQSKTKDFIQTIKHHLQQLNEEVTEKLNKRNKQKRKTRRKQRILKDKNQQKNDEQLQDENGQQDEELEDENYDQQVNQQQKQDLTIYENDPLRNKLTSQFKLKLSEQMDKYQKVVEQMKKKQAQKKKNHPQLHITEVLTIKHQKLDVKSSIQRLLNNHTTQELKQFTAYINLIDSLQNAIISIQTDMLLETNLNLKRSVIQKSKLNTQNSRFQTIKNNLNQPLDTQVTLDICIDEILINQFRLLDNEKTNTNKASQTANQNFKNPQLLILPESQLLNALEFIEKQSVKTTTQRNNKRNTSKAQSTVDPQAEFEEKQKILSLIFKNQKK